MKVFVAHVKSWLLPTHQMSDQQNANDYESPLTKWWIEVPGVILIPCAAWVIISAYGEPTTPSILLRQFQKWAVVGAFGWIVFATYMRSWLMAGIIAIALFYSLVIA